jgi:hypothetical protein
MFITLISSINFKIYSCECPIREMQEDRVLQDTDILCIYRDINLDKDSIKRFQITTNEMQRFLIYLFLQTLNMF